MRKIFIHSLFAVFTCLIGIALTFIILPLSQIPEIKVVSKDFDADLNEVYGFYERKIEIEYNYTLISKELSSAVFVVTNNTNYSIYYSGYEKNSHVENWIRQNNKLNSATDLPCYNGVKLQELKPNESAIFEIPIPRNKKPFEAGFDFKKSPKANLETLWVKVFEQNRFIQN